MKVIIEISKNSNLKYEYDELTNQLVLDRVLRNTNSFPYNYGFIPKTLAPSPIKHLGTNTSTRPDALVNKLNSSFSKVT